MREKPDHDARERLVRTVLGVDEAQASLTFAGDVPQGSLAQLMRANFDRLIDGAHEAATLTRSDEELAPQLARSPTTGNVVIAGIFNAPTLTVTEGTVLISPDPGQPKGFVASFGALP